MEQINVTLLGSQRKYGRYVKGIASHIIDKSKALDMLEKYSNPDASIGVASKVLLLDCRFIFCRSSLFQPVRSKLNISIDFINPEASNTHSSGRVDLIISITTSKFIFG